MRIRHRSSEIGEAERWSQSAVSNALSLFGRCRDLGVGQSLLGSVPVVGVAHVDAPAVHPDRVDRPAGLNEQIDRVRQLVLAALGGLDEVARVEDLRRKGVEPSHDEIGRRIVGFLHHFHDLAVLVRVEDAVAGGLFVGDLLNEEGGVGALFLLAVDHVAEIRSEDVVPQHEHEIVIDVRFRLQDGVGEAELLALVGVGDGDILVFVPVAFYYLLLHVADDEDELGRTDFDEIVHDVLEERFVVDFDEDLGFVVGEGPEARSFARGQYDCLHMLYDFNEGLYAL